jgi:hypothetical protein
MMAVTLGDLSTQILYETNKSGQEFNYGVTNAIITAIKYMEQKHPWVFSKTAIITIVATSTAVSNAVNLPADFNRLLDAKYAIGNCLYGTRQGFVSIPYDELNSLITNTAQTGYPLKYAIYGDQFYVYPFTNTNIDFTINYNYKDAIYPAVPSDTSVWFNDQTIDAVRNKALEVFYRDTLESPEIANSYVPIFQDYSDNLSRKNNKRSVYNLLSI